MNIKRIEYGVFNDIYVPSSLIEKVYKYYQDKGLQHYHNLGNRDDLFIQKNAFDIIKELESLDIFRNNKGKDFNFNGIEFVYVEMDEDILNCDDYHFDYGYDHWSTEYEYE